MNLQELAKAIEENKDRIVIEDRFGYRFRIAQVRDIGSKTDDPGIVIKVIQVHRY